MASAAAPIEDSVLDDVLTPIERSVKTYLTSSVAKDLVERLRGDLALIKGERDKVRGGPTNEP